LLQSRRHTGQQDKVWGSDPGCCPSAVLAEACDMGQVAEDVWSFGQLLLRSIPKGPSLWKGSSAGKAGSWPYQPKPSHTCLSDWALGSGLDSFPLPDYQHV